MFCLFVLLICKNHVLSARSANLLQRHFVNPLNTQYSLHGQVLETINTARNLGVSITKDFSWNDHICSITAKANRTLGFVKRNVCCVIMLQTNDSCCFVHYKCYHVKTTGYPVYLTCYHVETICSLVYLQCYHVETLCYPVYLPCYHVEPLCYPVYLSCYHVVKLCYPVIFSY